MTLPVGIFTQRESLNDQWILPPGKQSISQQIRLRHNQLDVNSTPGMITLHKHKHSKLNFIPDLQHSWI